MTRAVSGRGDTSDVTGAAARGRRGVTTESCDVPSADHSDPTSRGPVGHRGLVTRRVLCVSRPRSARTWGLRRPRPAGAGVCARRPRLKPRRAMPAGNPSPSAHAFGVLPVVGATGRCKDSPESTSRSRRRGRPSPEVTPVKSPAGRGGPGRETRLILARPEVDGSLRDRSAIRSRADFVTVGATEVAVPRGVTLGRCGTAVGAARRPASNAREGTSGPPGGSGRGTSWSSRFGGA